MGKRMPLYYEGYPLGGWEKEGLRFKGSVMFTTDVVMAISFLDTRKALSKQHNAWNIEQLSILS
jgi:hypothetical protein